MITRFLTAIQLTRLTEAFGAVSDILFVIILTKSSLQYETTDVFMKPWGLAICAGAVVALGLFSYGASLNDILDFRHDATFAPGRPLPAGRIRLGQAVVVTIGALLVAILGGAALGTWAVFLTLLTAAGVLFYNAAGKYIPAVGLVTIGLIHALHMLIPNHLLGFMLPVWLVFTHTLAIAAAVHILEEKRPKLSHRAWIAVGAAWLFWSALILGVGGLAGPGVWPADVPFWHALYPVAAFLAFLVVIRWKVVGAGHARGAAEKLRRYGAMWQSLYGAAWLMMLGLGTQAMWIGAFAVLGFIAMTIIREMTGLTGRPIAYRG